MSGDSGAYWTSRFDTIWHVDFEYREDANHLPVPVCMTAVEQNTGTEIFLWRDELLKLRHAPFGIGPRDLMVAYAGNAELSCFLMLAWPFPQNILDVYVETIAEINGRTDIWPSKGRPGLLKALELHELPAMMDQMTKDAMRDLILGKIEYTPEEREAIRLYNRSDVVETMALFNLIAPAIDWPRALLRGRYMAAVARMEMCGLPIDTNCLGCLTENWGSLQRFYIARDDEFSLYDGLSFREQRLWDLIAARGYDWPHTEHGRPQLKTKTLGQQAKRYPELKPLVRLRDTIAAAAARP